MMRLYHGYSREQIRQVVGFGSMNSAFSALKQDKNGSAGQKNGVHAEIDLATDFVEYVPNQLGLLDDINGNDQDNESADESQPFRQGALFFIRV